MSGREGRLAIVEDDRLLLDQLVFALKGTFDVVTARTRVAVSPSSRASRDLFLDRPAPAAVPRGGGGALPPRQIRSKRPEAAVVVMTGEAERRYALRAVELGAVELLRKPVEKTSSCSSSAARSSARASSPRTGP